MAYEAMIHRDEVIALLLEACPSYRTRWEEYRADPDFDAELLYVHLGDFADHVVSLLAQGDGSELSSVARELEHLHVDGDGSVKEAATIGLLEGIQNIAGHRGVSTKGLEDALGVETRRWWHSLNAFWSGKVPYVGADIAPASANLSAGQIMTMSLPSAAEARALLVELGAPRRLLRHVELVTEAANHLLTGLLRMRVPLNAEMVLAGVALHDVGKIRHPAELDQAGSEHEPAGQELLLRRGVSPALARICVSHAQWDQPGISFEELLVALADKLWKGVRKPDLEERVITGAAGLLERTRWDVFVELDSLFEEIAADGSRRLEESQT
jgi:hypothetical protein